MGLYPLGPESELRGVGFKGLGFKELGSFRAWLFGVHFRLVRMRNLYGPSTQGSILPPRTVPA